ncbi:MAG: DUF11 domain-containing protein, partial [Clostridia bacterium]|nr:DUF11 domain-containing protein [Clostridia bacterium]
QFQINLQTVTATVTKKPATLKSGSEIFIYDGKDHRNTAVEKIDILEGDEVEFTFQGFPKVTDVGETKSNTFEIVTVKGAQAKNYSYTTEPGEVKVAPRPLNDLLDSTTIYAKNGGGTYNGQQQRVSGWQYAVNDMIEFESNGLKFYVDVANLPVGAKGTNVSDTKQTTYSGTYRILDSKGLVVTDQFKPVTMNMGTLKIDPVALTITSASGERGYNGNVFRLDEANVTGGAFVGDEGATYTFTGERKKLGSVQNTFTYELKPGTLAENYDITLVYGTLNVINENGALDITITAASETVKYDGTHYAINSFAPGVDEDLTVDGIQKTIDGNTYTISGLSVYQTGRDATEGINVNVTGTPVVTDELGNNVTDSFTIHVKSGTLVINKRDVTLTSPDKTYIFDGKEHTVDDGEIIVGGDGWAEGEGVTYSKEGITLVGTKPNAFTYTMTGGTKPENYNITTVEGTLKVIDEGVDPESVVQNVLNNSSTVYDIGDEIVYTVTVTNIYDEAKTIRLSVPEGVTSEQSVFENVAPGEQVQTLAKHTVTPADIIAGKFENTVTADLADRSFTVSEASAQIAAESADISVTMVLSAVNGEAVTAAEPVTVKIGDELTYTIKAFNNGNVDLNNVVITDELTGDSWTVGTLAAGSASSGFNAVYTVTATDVAAGTVRNTAKVATTGSNNSDDPGDPDDEISVDVSVDRNFKVTYIVDGEELTTMDATCGESVPQPRQPQKDGYEFAWVDEIPETMPAENITINGTFTAIKYTATFVDENGKTVDTRDYTDETTSITEPAVPEKQGYEGKWEDYTLKIGGITVKPVYTNISGITLNTDGISETTGYKEDQTFKADVNDLPEGSEVHWFVNGEDVGTGSSYTVEDPTEDYTVQAKVIDKDGNVLAETETQKVHVKNGFFDRIKAFFTDLIAQILGKAIADLLFSVC